MDREEIIRMAREVGIEFDPRWGTCYTGNVQLERFAALVAAAERRACAEACEERQEVFQKYYTKGLAAMCAEAIRARGEQ
jgi:7-cyano-7-deazaguanine synthase in queuosine biosynthesis